MHFWVFSCIHNLVFSSLNTEVFLPVQRVVRSVFWFMHKMQIERSNLRADISFVGNDVGSVRFVAGISDLQGNEIGELALAHIRKAIIARDKLLPFRILEVVFRADRRVVEEGILRAKLGFFVSKEINGQSFSDPLLPRKELQLSWVGRRS